MTMRRWAVLTAVSALLLAITITWFLVGMRSQMAVGASCATGGPYVVVNPCPEHSTSLVLVGMFGSVLLALVGTVAAVSVGAPNLLVPYWTFTFGGMSVNFLVDGLTGSDAPVWSWILVGILMLGFVLPGVYLMTPWQRLYDREPMPGAPLSRTAWWLVYLALAAVGVTVGSWTAYAWL